MKLIKQHDLFGPAACHGLPRQKAPSGSLDWPIVTLNNPIWLPTGEVNAWVDRLGTLPDNGSLHVGMVSVRVLAAAQRPRLRR
jgi:hypothetical protein